MISRSMAENGKQESYVISLLSLFWKYKIVLMRSSCCLCVATCQYIAQMLTSEYLNQYLCNLVYIMAPEPILTAYFINPSHQSVFLHVYPLLLLGKGSINCITHSVARQRLSKNVTAAKNTHATIEELLEASFSMPSVSYQRNVGD
jgi:hypothetical protein